MAKEGWIPQPKRKDFKNDAEFQAAMEEFKSKLKDKLGHSNRGYMSPDITGTNDPSWHGADTEMGKSVGSLSFNYPIGLAQPLQSIGAGPGLLDPQGVLRQFSVCSARYRTVLPRTTNDGTLNARLCAQEIYTDMRRKNAGSYNYDPADLFIYMLAFGEAIAFHAWMVRLYGTVNKFSKINRSYPLALMKAQGVSPSVFADGQFQPELLSYINVYGRRLAKFCCPKIPMFARRIVLNSNIYSDTSEFGKGQIIIFTPEKVGIWNGTKYSTGSALESWKHDLTNINSMSDIKTIGNDIINTMLNDQDVGVISGDLKKAYEESGLMQVAEVKPDYEVDIVHDQEMLDMFENANIINGYWNDDSFEAGDIGQTANGEFVQYLVYDNASLPGSGSIPHLLNYRDDKITPARNLTSTTLLTGTTSVFNPGAGYEVSISSCGSEILSEVVVYNNADGSSAVATVQSTFITGNVSVARCECYSDFDYFPHTVCGSINTNTGVVTLNRYIGHLDNCRALSKVELDNIHFVSGANLMSVK